LGELAGDSFYVAIFQAATVVADVGQIVLITHLLSLEAYGRFAVAVASALMIGQLFDLRVGVAATLFGARRLQTNVASAAGIFQFTYVVDAVTGLLAFAVIAVAAPFLGPAVVGEQGTTLVVLYALTLLVSTVDESSFSILRLLNRFRLLAAYTGSMELLRLGSVAIALMFFGSLEAVVLVLVLHRAISGLAGVLLTARAFRSASNGVSLFRPALTEVRAERRQMLRTMLHTNTVSYSRLTQTHLPTMLLGGLAGSFEAGVYKVGMGAATFVAKLADPAYTAVLPRLSRLWEQSRRSDVAKLIRQATWLAIPSMALAVALLVILKGPIIHALGGDQIPEHAGTVLVVGAIAHAINSGLFWNIGVLFASGHSRSIALISVGAAVVQSSLLIPLIIWFGATGAAVALLVTLLALNIVATWMSLAAIRREPRASV